MLKKIFSKKTIASIGATAMILGNLTAVASADDDYSEATVKYECTGTVLGVFSEDFDIDVTIRAKVPESVNANTTYQILDSSATVVLPEDSLNLLRGQLGWTSFKGSVTKFEVHSDNLPQTKNVASPSIAIPSTPVPSSGDLQFTVPGSGGINVSFDAGSSGVITLTAGDISATFEKVRPILDPGWPFTLSVNCSPKDGEDLTLETIEIN